MARVPNTLSLICVRSKPKATGQDMHQPRRIQLRTSFERQIRELCCIFICTHLLRLYTCAFSLYAGKKRNKSPVNDLTAVAVEAGQVSERQRFDSF